MTSVNQPIGSDPLKSEENEEEALVHAVLRLNGVLLGLVFGLVLGLIIFLATLWLTIKGGERIGPHLNLLGQFFWGYSVSYVGSLVGAVYGFLAGFATGWIVAWIYNGIVMLRSPRR